MSASVPYHFTTAANTNLQPLRAGQSGNLKGLSVLGVAAAIFVKFYWFTETSGSNAPTVGTTVPNLTVAVPITTNVNLNWPDGITGTGQMWIAVTGAVADNDSTAATAGAVVTVLVE